MQSRNELGFLVPSRYGNLYHEDRPKELCTPSQSAPPSPEPLLALNTIMGSSPSSPNTSPRTSGPNLLTIPLEIRLQIYHYVLLAHPIHHAHLAPLTPPPNFSGLNTVEFHTTMKRANSPPLPTEVVTYTLITSPISDLHSLLQHQYQPTYTSNPLCNSLYSNKTRIQSKIPTALLISASQIYRETSLLPFHTNTFSFINWFQSGVYASRSFTKDLQPWQREGMRSLRVEVLGRDLWCGSERREGKCLEYVEGSGRKERGIEEWRGLCEMWRGVRSLELVIRGSLEVGGAVDGSGSSTSTTSSSANASRIQIESAENSQHSILNVDNEWVSHGLLLMKSLRMLELEIEDVDISREIKMEFCAALDRTLNAEEKKEGRCDGWTGRTSVVYVETGTVVKEVQEERFVYYGGEPGDEEVWRDAM